LAEGRRDIDTHRKPRHVGLSEMALIQFDRALPKSPLLLLAPVILLEYDDLHKPAALCIGAAIPD
jgi:hypothetical protein